MVQDGSAPVFSWQGPRVRLPSPLCWGQRHAQDTALDPRPLQRAQRGRLLRGKVAEGRSPGSGEQHGNAGGKGTVRGGTALHRVQGVRWGLGFTSGLFLPKITRLLPPP